MEVIDKILNEWSFRCHDGIVDMNDPIKLSLLNEILGFDLDEAKVDMENIWKKYFADVEVKTTVKRDADIYDENGKKTEGKIKKGEQVITQPISSYKSKIPVKYNGNIVNILISTINTDLEPEGDTIDYYLWVLKNEANIKDQSVLDEIKEIYIRNNDESNFKNNFRKKEDINQSNLDEIYNAFKAYIEVGSKKRGVGKGEYTVLLGLNKSESGSTAEKDIIVGDGDGKKVYEVKELAGKEFRTGSGGYITNTAFQRNYNYLMTLLSQLSLNDSEIYPQISKLVNYFNKTYKKGNISEGILKALYLLLPKLKDYNFKDNYDGGTYIKIKGKKYRINSEETDEEGNPISIKLGGEVSEQNAIITKLKNHPWVKNHNTLYDEFNDIWLSYLKNITGFIVYDGNKLEFYPTETIKQNFGPVRIIQNQINVLQKGSEDNTDEE